MIVYTDANYAEMRSMKLDTFSPNFMPAKWMLQELFSAIDPKQKKTQKFNDSYGEYASPYDR